MMVGGGYVGMPKGMSIPGYQDGKVVKTSDEVVSEGVKSLSRSPIFNKNTLPENVEEWSDEIKEAVRQEGWQSKALLREQEELSSGSRFDRLWLQPSAVYDYAKIAVARLEKLRDYESKLSQKEVNDRLGDRAEGYGEELEYAIRPDQIIRMSIPNIDDSGIRSIPEYKDGNVVQGGNMVEEMPAYRQKQLAKEAEYQKAIEKTASLFLNPFQGLLRDYDFNLDYFARNLSGGHQIPKEQVMQDLRKSISAQRKEMPVKEGFMGKARRRFSGVDKASPMSKEMLDADGLASGGIVGLENGGIMPELFEGEEIVETNPTINAMAAQGGGDFAGEAMPERNVPNERGIISMALETEDEPVEDDKPMIVLAKQEAKARLDEEFRIIKSTAEAEAATGGSPSAVIKSGMDGLARSARRIETETADKYPEVPADANLISSEDLVPYREEFVAMFKAPEIGTEEPMMQDIVMAKNGGKIPGYEDGGVADVPEEWSWIDEDIRAKGMSLEESEREMIQRYGSDITAMRKILRKDRETSPREKEKIRRGMSLEELANRDTREADLITAMKEMGFETASQPSIFQRKQNRTMDIIKNPEVKKLIEQYRTMGEPLSAVQGQGQGDPQAGDQGQGDPIIKDGLPTTGEMLEQGTVSAGGNTAIPSTISSDSIVAAQEEMKETLRKNLEDLKTSTKKGLEDLSSPIEISMEKYETQATAQDETMEDIFADIERRIPIQAKVSGRLSPFTGGGAQASLVRGLRTQEIEQNLFQQNNANKIEFYNLRKQETEARRNKDFEALQNIKLKQLEIIEGIDNTLITETMKLDRDMLAQRIQLEIAQLEVGSKLGAPDYDWSKQLEDVGQGNQNFDEAVENMIAGGNAEYIIKENIVSGQKTITNPQTGAKKNITFREFYETKAAAGVPIKEIVEEWSKLPKPKKS